MSVRSKLSLATGLVLIFLLLILYGGGRSIIVSSLRRAEQEAILRVMPLLEQSLQSESKLLSTLATGQAADSELYAWMEKREDSFATTRFAPDAVNRMELDLLVIADQTGRPITGQVRHPGAEELGPPPLSLEADLKPGQPLRDPAPRPAESPAIIMVEDAPMLVVARPIVGAHPGQPPRGVLLVGRRLDTPVMRTRLAGILNGFSAESTLAIRAYTRLVRPVGTVEGEEEALSAGRVVIRPVGTEVFRAILPIYDVYSKPVFSIVCTMPRTYSQRAEWALAALTSVIATVGLVFELILFAVQHRTVLNPLTRMANEIRSYHGGDATSRRIGWTRSDEFGVVAREVDRMLDSIEQKHAAVVENERRSRALLEANPDIMAVFDRDGVVLDFRSSSNSTLFAPPHEVRGRRLEETDLPPAVAARYRHALARVLEHGTPEMFEYMRPRSEEAVWGEVRLVRMDDRRALAIIRDITARKRAEEERTRLNEKMRQIQKLESLGVLASGVAHDFNNLLTIIVGYAELTKASLTENVTAVEMTDNIRDSAKRAAGLARQMLAYAGQGGFEFERIELNHFLDDLNPLLRASISKKAALEIHADPDVPVVAGDAVQLRQVIVNLAVNASEAMGEQSGRIVISTRRAVLSAADLTDFLSAEPLLPGEYALIEVQDNGCGMDAATMARVFDPFFSTKAVGRGLGLSATLGLVRAHHGGIAVRSVPREGTTFRIILPPAPSVVPVAPDKATAVPPAGQRATVLVVDDEDDIRRISTLMLQAAGYDVLSARDGREAMAVFNQHGPRIGLILLDVEMPVMNGTETFAAIRQTGSNVPIVIISGYGDSMIRSRFRALDPAGFLFKPFTSDQLLASAIQALATAPRA